MPEPPSHAAPTGKAANGSARHGRAPVRESAADAALRHSAVRQAVVPAVTVSGAAAAVTAYALTRTGSGAAARTDPALWAAFGGGLLFVCLVVALAAHHASASARAAQERYAALRRSVARGRAEARTLVRGLEQGERLPERTGTPPPDGPDPEADALDHLAHEIGLARRTAEEAIGRAAAFVESSSSGSQEQVEVFVNLSRRLQSLVHREIELLDELENKVEDPDLLKGLFQLDHLTTRIRRHAENLAVLGGAVSRRQWNRPVTTTEVLRSATAEVEQYSRVKLVPPVQGTLSGHAVADVIHLLAELVENATVFSSPQTHVVLRAQQVTAGLAIEVEDRGLGMTPAEQNRMNAVLSDPDRVDVGQLLQDGRIGLFVVSALARRHGIVVQLQSNIYGGIQAVLVLPRDLLGAEQAAVEAGPSAKTEEAPSAAGSAAEAATSASGASPAAQPAAGTGTPPAGVPGPRHAAPAGEPVVAGGQAAGEPRPLPRRRPQGGGPGSYATPEPPPISTTVRDPAGTPAGPAPETPPAPEPPVTEPQPTAEQPPHAPEFADPRAYAPEHAGAPPHADGATPGGVPVPGPPHVVGTPAAGVPAGGEGAPEAAGGVVPCGDRPGLPRRQRQQHLVPELRAPAATRRSAEHADDSDRGHDPGLMAAFQRGTSLAEDTDSYDDSHTDGIGGAAAAPGAPARTAPEGPADPGFPGSADSRAPAGDVPPSGELPRPAR
ncbi:ATP-binding protein [Streptomyces sp. HNM0574]|uniref:sensor histidine kinase n=1 Tax=Streptomyces sp. HNM0574 TaxID=2714954 RepID=UPI0019D19583|nr:ATP-binding protein [Streptomyces sp. HNM0574]